MEPNVHSTPLEVSVLFKRGGLAVIDGTEAGIHERRSGSRVVSLVRSTGWKPSPARAFGWIACERARSGLH